MSIDQLPYIDANTPLVLKPIKPVGGATTPLGLLHDTNPELYKRVMGRFKKLFEDKLNEVK